MDSIFRQAYDTTTPPDLLTFVSHPYAQTKDIDPVSKLFQVMQATRSSPAIAIFYTFALMSHWNLRRGVTYKVPKDIRTHHPVLWIMALAPSGSSKTQQVSLVNALLDKDRELRSSFSQPASPASLIEQFRIDPIQMWFEDEASKYLRLLENPTHALAPIKGHLLKIKGGDPLTYHSKKDGEVIIENPRMTIFFLNTIAGLLKTISEESFVDGFLSRIGIVLSEMTPEMSDQVAANFPDNLHDLTIIKDSGLKEDLERMFAQDISGNEYTFEACVDTYEQAVNSLRVSFSWMQGENNVLLAFFNRTVMESFKYAIFHHQMMGKQGTEIDPFSMEYGLRVARYTLCSVARFVSLRETGLPASIADKKAREQQVEEKVARYVTRNPRATLRQVYRVNSLPKDECCRILQKLGLLEGVISNSLDAQMRLPLKPSSKSKA